MAFHDERFPPALSFGSLGGPERRTEIVELTNGFEERNTPWAQARRRYDAGVGLRSLDDVAEIVAFFEAREGQLHAFRWKDWSDYKSCAPSKQPAADDQQIGTGDEVTVTFQLVKHYGPSIRVISKPVEGSVSVASDRDLLERGSDWEVDCATGLVTMARPPQPGARITAGFEFDVPARFDTDRILTSVASFQAGEVPDIPVIEVRL